MKRALLFALLASLLGGCAATYERYDRDSSYSYYRGDGYYHRYGYGYGSGWGYQDREHGS